MSKLGKKPITIPQGVEVQLRDGVFYFKGSQGSLEQELLPGLTAEIKDNQIIIKPLDGDRQTKANWGTMVALIKNTLQGVSQGFSKTLQMEGIGFRAQLQDKDLILSVGFSHPVKFTPPQGVKVSVEKNLIKISGIDRQLVGQAAAQIRKIKPPEPYLGKGIRYEGEIIRRKAGKKAAATATTA